jgi:hypothetical protein
MVFFPETRNLFNFGEFFTRNTDVSQPSQVFLDGVKGTSLHPLLQEAMIVVGIAVYIQYYINIIIDVIYIYVILHVYSVCIQF